MVGDVVDDRVVDKVRGELQEECARAERGGIVAKGLDGDAAGFREGEQRLRGLFGEERQVNPLPGEGPPVGAAEKEQCLGKVDRTCVNRVEAFDEIGGGTFGVAAGDLEQRLGDGERRAQLMRGVGREPLLLGVVCLEPREHRVESIRELAELVLAALEVDPMGQRSIRGGARGVRDASQRGEHPAGENPPSHEPEHQQETQDAAAARGANARTKSDCVGTEGPGPMSDRRARSAGGRPIRPPAGGCPRASGSRRS